MIHIGVGILFIALLSSPKINPESQETLEINTISASNPDLPIVAIGNSQLADDASSGSGSPSDPYIIEDLIINASTYGMSAVEIWNTDACLIIRNCTFFDTSSMGIYLQNVDNVLITNNTIYLTDGVYVSGCSNLTIHDNTIYNGAMDGISLYNTVDSTISQNTIQNNADVGIYLDSSSTNNIIEDNRIIGSHTNGIALESNCDFNTLDNNTVSGCVSGSSFEGNGFYIWGNNNTITNNNASDNTGTHNSSGNGFLIFRHGNTIVNNTATGNSGTGWYSGNGIHVDGGDNNVITHNYLASNTGSNSWSGNGIMFDSADDNLMKWNILETNENEGIYLRSTSDNNSIYLNKFDNNNGGGIQAYDDGINNDWYSGTLGNYWSDYLSVNPNATILGGGIYWSYSYPVSGTASSLDWRGLVNYYHGYIPMQNIVITNNGDFATFASRGSGFEEDPYILEDLAINGSAVGSGHGIHIENTIAHYEIRHCLIIERNGSIDYGIDIEDTIHGIITNCNISQSSTGIFLDNATYMTIFDNEVSFSKLGIRAWSRADHNNISYNYVHDIYDRGISSYNADYCTYDSNIVADVDDIGYQFTWSEYNTISNNSAENVIGNSSTYGRGFEIFGTNKSTLSGNRVNNVFGDRGYNGWGFYFSQCSENLISNCNSTLAWGDNYTTGLGFYISDCENNTFSDCVSSDNFAMAGQARSGLGYYLRKSDNNDFISCLTYDNHGESGDYTGNGFYLNISHYNNFTSCNSFNNFGDAGLYSGNGYYIWNSSFNSFNGCNSSDNEGNGLHGGNGFYLVNAPNSTLVDCRANNNDGHSQFCGNGFYVVNSDEVNLTRNNVHANIGWSNMYSGNGMLLVLSDHVNLTECISSNNTGSVAWSGNGIYLIESSNCTVDRNQILNNDHFGLTSNGSGSIIYLNNFSNNFPGGWQTNDYPELNTWHYGGLGNYYSDYQSTYPTANMVLGAYWDMPYEGFFDTCMDLYPLVEGNLKHSFPISISNDAELADAASSGAGTYHDPYILESYYINASIHGTSAIDIRNTRLDFILKDCVLVDSTADGIYMENVSYGIANNITIPGCQTGFDIRDSIEITVSSCNISGTDQYGINLENTNGSTIEDNIMEDGIGFGVILSYSSNNDVINNHATNFHTPTAGAGCGFGLDASHDNYIFNNTATNIRDGAVYSGCGFLILSCERNILEQNTAYNLVGGTGMYSGNGFALMASPNSTLIDNVAYNCIGTSITQCGNGFYMQYSDDSIFRGNLAYGNSHNGTSQDSGNGFYIYNSDGLMIEDNIAHSNVGTSSNSGNGFNLDSCNWCTVVNNTAYNNTAIGFPYSGNGIFLTNCYNNQLEENTGALNIGSSLLAGNGIALYYSHYNNLTNNDAYLNYGTSAYSGNGFLLFTSDNNTLLQNFASQNTGNDTLSGIGLYLEDANSNHIMENNITNNSQKGVYLENSDFNIVINNDLRYNPVCVEEGPGCSNNVLTPNTCDSPPQPPDLTMAFIIIGVVAGIEAICMVAVIGTRKSKRREPTPTAPPILKSRPKKGNCTWHGRKLNGPVHVCSHCGVEYCLECVVKMLYQRDTCRFCGESIDYYAVMRAILENSGAMKVNIEYLIKARSTKKEMVESYYSAVRDKLNEERKVKEQDLQHTPKKSTKEGKPEENYYGKARESLLSDREKKEKELNEDENKEPTR
ncbi:MAG: right-handed parallel beta-helix repeat-containing protein [Candidatus Hodarchaeota archaeon]